MPLASVVWEEKTHTSGQRPCSFLAGASGLHRSFSDHDRAASHIDRGLYVLRLIFHLFAF